MCDHTSRYVSAVYLSVVGVRDSKHALLFACGKEASLHQSSYTYYYGHNRKACVSHNTRGGCIAAQLILAGHT